MKIEHILGNTYCLSDKSISVPFYMVDEKRVVLLDSGLDTDPQRSELISLLEPYEVVAVISTHAHPDHVGANQYYQQRGAKIYMPHFEAGCLESADNLKAWYNLFCSTEIEKLFSHILFDADFKLEKDRTSVTIEEREFGVIHAPGHTMDQICIMTPDNVLYLADALLSERECKLAKLPYSFLIRRDKTTREKLKSTGAEGYILAHGGYVSDISELIAMNEKCFEDCAKRIYDLIDRPMTLEEILEKVIIEFDLRQNTSIYVFRVYERNLRSFVDHLCDQSKLIPRVMGAKLYYVRSE